MVTSQASTCTGTEQQLRHPRSNPQRDAPPQLLPARLSLAGKMMQPCCWRLWDSSEGPCWPWELPWCSHWPSVSLGSRARSSRSTLLRPFPWDGTCISVWEVYFLSQDTPAVKSWYSNLILAPASLWRLRLSHSTCSFLSPLSFSGIFHNQDLTTLQATSWYLLFRGAEVTHVPYLNGTQQEAQYWKPRMDLGLKQVPNSSSLPQPLQCHLPWAHQKHRGERA